MFGLSATVIQLLLGAIEEAPTLFEDAKSVFDEIGKMQDGVGKLTKAAAGFAALAGHAANSATAAATGSSSSSGPAPATPVASSGAATGGTARVVTDGDPNAPAAGPSPAAVAQQVVSGGVATDSAGRPLDANGNPILNAADQAALAAQAG